MAISPKRLTPVPNDPTQSTGVFLAPFSAEGGGAEAEEGVDFKRYLHAVRKRLWLVIGLAVIGGVAAGVYTLRQPKLYRAQTTVIVDTKSTSQILTGVTDVVPVGAGGFWADNAFYQKEMRVLQSRAVARRAGEKVGVLADDVRTGLATITDPSERERRRAELDAADFVEGRYQVQPEESMNVVHIRVVDVDPKFAADLANAVAEAYAELNVEKRVDATRDASTWLAVQHTELRQKLEASEDALYKFMEQENVLNASLKSQLDEVMQRLQAFNGQLAEVQAERIRNQLEAKALGEVRESPALIDTIPEIRDAPVIAALKTRLIELRAKKAELSERYQEAYPAMQRLNEQIALVEKNLEKEIDSVLLSLERRQASVEHTERGLKAAIAEERQREARLNRLSLDYDRLKREVDTNSRLYELVTTRMKEADLTGALRVNNITLLDRAMVPSAPFKPNLRNNLAMGLVLALLLGIGLAILIDLLDNTVKTQEDVEKNLELPFLGLLPVIEAGKVNGKDGAAVRRSLQERDLYVLRNPKSSPAECARFIRTNLLFMMPEKPLKTLVVTSAGPQEGKTTTAVSLAVTMAQSGSRTLIVDTDMRRPRLHHAFGVSNDVGLSSVIVGEAKLEDAVQKTEEANLDVLVCGPIPPNPAELLHTERFRELTEQLKRRYDRILFDSPPVGAVADPLVLGTQSDGTLLVLKCQKTSRDAAKQTLRALRDANVPVLGAVLNDVDLESKRYGGYYYQYYRKYGGYYGESAEPAKSA